MTSVSLPTHLTKSSQHLCSQNSEKRFQNWPSLWHFHTTRVRQQRNIQGTHLSVGNWEDAACHNLPDLRAAIKREVEQGHFFSKGFRLTEMREKKWNWETFEDQLTSCVKKTERIRLSADHHCHGIIVKNLWKHKKEVSKKGRLMVVQHYNHE